MCHDSCKSCRNGSSYAAHGYGEAFADASKLSLKAVIHSNTKEEGGVRDVISNVITSFLEVNFETYAFVMSDFELPEVIGGVEGDPSCSYIANCSITVEGKFSKLLSVLRWFKGVAESYDDSVVFDSFTIGLNDGSYRDCKNSAIQSARRNAQFEVKALTNEGSGCWSYEVYTSKNDNISCTFKVPDITSSSYCRLFDNLEKVVHSRFSVERWVRAEFTENSN